MDRNDIIKAVNSIFIDQFEIEEMELSPDKTIFNDLGLDSLDMVDLMVGLQRKFGIPLRQSEEIRKIEKLNDIYDFFVKLIDEHPDAAARFKNGTGN